MTTVTRSDLELMQQACLLCDKSKCGYKIGCIAVKDGTVLIEGWNETLPGETFCQNGSCVRETENLRGGKSIDRVCSIHAEASVVAQAASKGISLAGATVYATTFPCLICTKLLVKTGIAKLIYMSDYMGDNLGMTMFSANNIQVLHVTEHEVWGRA